MILPSQAFELRHPEESLLNATLLGHHELGAAVSFDGLVSGPMLFVVAFAIAAAFMTCGDTVAARLRTFVTRNPR